MDPQPIISAFSGFTLVATGPAPQVLLAAAALSAGASQAEPPALLYFDEQTGRPLDFNLHGTPEQMLARELPSPEEPHRAGRGRPKLGVVSREITLLPRHWEWLEAQRGGASAALRRLVEEASRADAGQAQLRQTREAVGRVMGALAGDLPGYEEALRALYAGDDGRFLSCISAWPPDLAGWLARRLGGGAGAAR